MGFEETQINQSRQAYREKEQPCIILEISLICNVASRQNSSDDEMKISERFCTDLIKALISYLPFLPLIRRMFYNSVCFSSFFKFFQRVFTAIYRSLDL